MSPICPPAKLEKVRLFPVDIVPGFWSSLAPTEAMDPSGAYSVYKKFVLQSRPPLIPTVISTVCPSHSHSVISNSASVHSGAIISNSSDCEHPFPSVTVKV